MKVLQLILTILIAVELVEIARADDDMDIVAMKRPFCNAFTGCGRKRNPALAVYPQQQQLPLPLLYRALRLYPNLRNAIVEAKMRQRFAAEDPSAAAAAAFNPVELALEQPAFAVPRGAPIY